MEEEKNYTLGRTKLEEYVQQLLIKGPHRGRVCKRKEKRLIERNLLEISCLQPINLRNETVERERNLLYTRRTAGKAWNEHPTRYVQE